MYGEILRAMAGVAIFPIVSLLTFAAVFGVVLIRTARLDRGKLDQFAQLPLSDTREGSVRPEASFRQGVDL